MFVRTGVAIRQPGFYMSHEATLEISGTLNVEARCTAAIFIEAQTDAIRISWEM